MWRNFQKGVLRHRKGLGTHTREPGLNEVVKELRSVRDRAKVAGHNAKRIDYAAAGMMGESSGNWFS